MLQPARVPVGTLVLSPDRGRGIPSPGCPAGGAGLPLRIE